jgi:serine phosphatase RsbU (regulator of sigma subunit)
LIDGSERLGAIEVAATRPGAVLSPTFRTHCEMYAALVGHLVAVKSPYGDGLTRARRSAPMSPAAELIRQLVPPLTFACNRLVISGILEPCYNVGGDGFDYAVDDNVAYLAVFDTSGRGLHAAAGTAVVLSATRAARRAGAGLGAIARAADDLLVQHSGDALFTTAIIGQLDLETGLLRYLNAGHPPALLLRRGTVVRRLDRGRRLPLGLDDPAIQIAQETLEPGDRFLFYTDGVTEARGPDRVLFGEQRLVDLFERFAVDDLPAPETLRRICHAALRHHGGPAADDTTLVMVEWMPQLKARMLA